VQLDRAGVALGQRLALAVARAGALGDSGPPARSDRGVRGGQGDGRERRRGGGSDAAGLPEGTVRKGKWAEADSSTEYCQKPNGTKHGPYREQEYGYDLDEGLRGESGEYRDGKKHGLWYEFASFSGSSYGAYVDGAKHGLWVEEGREFEVSYEVYVLGKQEARSRMYRGAQLILEQHYEQGQLHGAYRSWTWSATTTATEKEAASS